MSRFFALTIGLLALVAALSLHATRPARADEGWIVRSFAATYKINTDSSVDIVEDITVDFGGQQKHGIFRYIPTEYAYDARHHRRIALTLTAVDNGQTPWKSTTSQGGASYVIKIGDADRLISGVQRYRISYRVTGAMNPQMGTDEFYWNVTGDKWPVSIDTATATVTAPALADLTCFEGPTGATRNCASRPAGNAATFATTRRLNENEGLTIVVALPKGAVAVPPANLVVVKTPAEQVRDFVGLKPLPIAAAVFVAVLGFALLARVWWITGRDRWLGDVHYLTDSTNERPRPFMAPDTVVVEYQPPELPDTQRRLRPAEIGTLLDERADTLDVSASIVDLGVRGYLKITEVPKEGLFGKKDYRLERLKPADAELLPFETKLLDALFDDGESVTMSSLKNKFYEDLSEVKSLLYEQVWKTDGLFSRQPETARMLGYVGGIVVAGLGVLASLALGTVFGAAIVGLPVVIVGLLALLMAGSMPQRTGKGREMLRRCFGFREYMVVAEKDRQKFYEEEGIFEKYLPYAMVYHCVDKWAKVFQDLGLQPSTSGWYVGTAAFAPLAFSQDLQSFSNEITSAIASTPGGSGGSGFGGGGFSGGGGGGGGGGSW